MIISVTPNTAIDYTLCVPEFALGHTIRSLECAWGMGGKAADASWILGHWGMENLVLGFAAGRNGKRMEDMLRERGCQTDFVWVEGETRLNVVICMDESHSTFTSSTLDVAPHHIEAILLKYRKALELATCVIVGGSLPKGVPATFFIDIIRLARDRHVPVIFDSSGDALKIGLDAYPSVIKPNLTELLNLSEPGREDGFGTLEQLPHLQEIYDLGQQVQAKFGVSMVITLGKEGALAIFDDSSYWIPPLKVSVVSAAGAGDAVLAGLAIAYSEQLSIVEGLRLGFALATAVLSSAATADFSLDVARNYLSQINVIPIPRDGGFNWPDCFPGYKS